MVEKFICAQCGKEDFKECLLGDGKKFCCAVCVENYKKMTGQKEEEKEESGKNVCTFC